MMQNRVSAAPVSKENQSIAQDVPVDSPTFMAMSFPSPRPPTFFGSGDGEGADRAVPCAILGALAMGKGPLGSFGKGLNAAGGAPAIGEDPSLDVSFLEAGGMPLPAAWGFLVLKRNDIASASKGEGRVTGRAISDASRALAMGWRDGERAMVVWSSLAPATRLLRHKAPAPAARKSREREEGDRSKV